MSLLGLDIVGADYGAIFSTVFQAAGGAVDYAQHEKEAGAAAASADSALAAAIAADRAATTAAAKANTSALVAKADPSKAGASKADKAAADKAVVVQDSAGAAVPEEKRAERVKAAQEAVDSASRRVSAASGSMKIVAQAGLNAAKQTLEKAKGSDKKSEGDGAAPASFFSKTIVGGVKIWHVLVAVVAAGAAALAFKKSHHK